MGVATSVEVSPAIVVAHSGKALGELVGVFKADGYDNTSGSIDIAETTVFFNKSQSVVEDIFGALGRVVVVLNGEDDTARGVDDAKAVGNAYLGALGGERADFVIEAGDDLSSRGGKEAILAVAADRDSSVKYAAVPCVNRRGEGFHGGVIESHAVIGASEEEGVAEEGGHLLKYSGENDATRMIDNAPMIVDADQGVSTRERLQVLIARREDLLSITIDECTSIVDTVEGQQNRGTAFDKVACLRVLLVTKVFLVKNIISISIPKLIGKT